MNKQGVIDLGKEIVQKFIQDPENTKKEVIELINTYKDPAFEVIKAIGLTPENIIMKCIAVKIKMIKKYKDELNISMREAIDLANTDQIVIEQISTSFKRMIDNP